MIHITGVVVYPDGRRDTFAGGPRDWVAWEQYALGHGLPTSASDPARAAGLTMTWYLAYSASTRTQKDRPGYLAWLDSISDVVDVEVVNADPTHAAPSPAASSNLPRTSEPVLTDSLPGVRNSSQPSPTF